MEGSAAVVNTGSVRIASAGLVIAVGKPLMETPVMTLESLVVVTTTRAKSLANIEIPAGESDCCESQMQVKMYVRVCRSSGFCETWAVMWALNLTCADACAGVGSDNDFSAMGDGNLCPTCAPGSV